MAKVVELGSRSGGAASPRVTTISLLESAAAFWARLAKIGPGRLLLGFPKYEAMIQPTVHQYVILAGRPGMFKSTVAWVWAVNLASSGKKVLWLGAEMTADRMAAWAVSRRTRIKLTDLLSHGRGQRGLSSSESEDVRLAEEAFGTLPLVLWAQESLTVQQVREAILAVPYDVVFLDYIGLVQTTRGAKEPDRVAQVSGLLRELKSSNPFHLVALAQMNREIERTQNGKPRVPNLADLKGSSQLEADADVVAFLHRAEVGPAAPRDHIQLRIEKNRDGPTGVINLIVRPEIKDVYEPEEAVPMGLPGTAESA